MSDWTTLPPGYYAVEIFTEDYDLVGYHLVEKTRKGLVKVSARGTEGGLDRLIAAIDYEREMYGEGHLPYYLSDPLLQQAARETFGKVNGRCGCCGKRLTDPDSKMRGIGPECRKAVLP